MGLYKCDKETVDIDSLEKELKSIMPNDKHDNNLNADAADTASGDESIEPEELVKALMNLETKKRILNKALTYLTVKFEENDAEENLLLDYIEKMDASKQISTVDDDSKAESKRYRFDKRYRYDKRYRFDKRYRYDKKAADGENVMIKRYRYD
jgi:hypothetical protein